MNLVVVRELYTAEHYISPAKLPSPLPSLMTAFVLFALCKALAHEMRLRRRVRSLAFCELWGLAIMGVLSSDPLFRVSI